jgi:hypothetical protein
MDNAALDELERVARALTYPDDWHTEGRNVCSPAGFVVAEAHGSASAPDELMIRATYIAAFDPPTILALITAARRPALPDREAVAKVIDPEAFKANTYVYDMYPIRRIDALAKADAILAMLLAAPKETPPRNQWIPMAPATTHNITIPEFPKVTI